MRVHGAVKEQAHREQAHREQADFEVILSLWRQLCKLDIERHNNISVVDLIYIIHRYLIYIIYRYVIYISIYNIE